MLRNTYLFESILFTNKVNAASFEVGKEKKKLILRVKITQEFEEMCEVAFY
jgi:hypothetical protein